VCDFINEQCVQQWQLTFFAAAVAECAADILDSVGKNTVQIIEAINQYSGLNEQITAMTAKALTEHDGKDW